MQTPKRQRRSRLRDPLGRAEKARRGGDSAVLSASMDGFLAFELEGRIVDVNEAACRLLGYAREELLSMSMGQVEAKETPEEMARHCEQIRRTGQDRFETRFRCRDGHEVCVEVSASSVFLGKPCIIGFARDMTDRIRTEQLLRESQKRYRTLAEASPNAIFIVGRDLRVNYVNSAAAELWRRPPEELVGCRQDDLFPPETVRQQNQVLAGVLETGETVRRDELVPMPGSGRWLETRLTPIRSEDGTITAVLGVAHDITERKRGEFLLQAQRDVGIRLSLTSDLKTALQQLLEIVVQFDGLDCGDVYLIDPATGTLRLEAHCGLRLEFVQNITDYSAETPQARLVQQGKPLYAPYSSMLPNSAQMHASEGLRGVAVLPLCHEGGVLGVLNAASHTRDEIPGQTRTVLEAIAAQAAGAIARIRTEEALLRSLTERERLEHQILEISDREQARIGQDIHDGLCQQLVSLAFDANSLERELSAANRAEAAKARRIAVFLDQAITDSRHLSRGLFPVRLEAEGLPSALAELAVATRERSHVDCRFECDPRAVLPAGALATHLFRIAQEAVANAVKHSGASHIQVRLRAQSGQIVLSIDDDGSGLDATAARNSQGMGMRFMDYRARSAGGTLHLGPSPLGGTAVCCCVPIPGGGQSAS